jgi:hypothetical protein
VGFNVSGAEPVNSAAIMLVVKTCLKKYTIVHC